MSQPEHSRRRSDKESNMGDAMRAALIALLVAGAFLAGVLTANQQTRKIVDEVKVTAEEVKADLKHEIERQDRESFEHRDRDRVHICTAAIDHLEMSVALYDLATQAGLDPSRFATKLRPEVLAICDEIGINGSKR